MPKFKRPKNAVGLNLRAVIEGELMKLPRFGFDYAVVEDIATIIEKRIQDGPSDWLTLSNGTTFDKTWVPEGQEVPTYRPRVPETVQEPTFKIVEQIQDETIIDLSPVTTIEQAIEKIHAAHNERVLRNNTLEHEIKEFEAWKENA